MGGFNFWLRWLKIVGFLLVLFGIFMGLFNASPFFALFNDNIDPVFWGGDPLVRGTQDFRTWVYGAWGATIAGWGVSLLFLIYNAYEKRARWAWFAIALGLGIWYVLDTGVSIIFRVHFNVVFNSLILLAVVIPLAGTYQQMRG